jgi:pyruvyltransferase
MENFALYYWRLNSGFGNIGDELSKILIEKINPNIKTVYDSIFKHKLLGIGSILNRAKDGDIVWGSGFLNNEEIIKCKNVNIELIRGPLSYAKIKNQIKLNENYGDPALITPLFFPIKKEKIYDIGIIPHFSDEYKIIDVLQSYKFKKIKIISPRTNPICFLKYINQCDIILSSSLHGIILADAYKIPNAYVKFFDNPYDDFKFKDYFYSQDRKFIYRNNINDAINIVNLSNVINSEKILNSFPKIF